MEKNGKIYIAGHNGLVGSAIARNLSAHGFNNQVFTPYPQYDLTDQKTVAAFFEKEKPGYVFLAAAKVGGIMSNNVYRAQFIYENLMIENNIIHQSYVHGVKKLLFLGSSCIYPGNCPQPIKEEYLLTGELEYTNEPYAIAKISGIKMCESYNIQYGTNFVSVMPTNLYGPNDNYNLETSHVLPALVRKMHLGKCLENNDWDSLRKDLKKRPIEGVNENSPDSEIISILGKYGIKPAPRSEAEIPLWRDGTQHLEAKRRSRFGGTAPSTSKRSGDPASAGQHPVSITLWGTGSPYREFLYVDDLAEACVYVINNVDFNDLKDNTPVPHALSSVPSAQIKNTHINIGTGKDLTIKELAILIKDTVGFKGQLNWDSSKPDGTYRKLLDVSKINRLGWKEKVGLEEGIGMIYNAYIS